MVMTSEAIRYDLSRIDALIVALGGDHHLNEDDFGDLKWLRRQRAALLGLLASRRTLQRRKIVNLEVWRNGSVARPSLGPKAASSPQENVPSLIQLKTGQAR